MSSLFVYVVYDSKLDSRTVRCSLLKTGNDSNVESDVMVNYKHN